MEPQVWELSYPAGAGGKDLISPTPPEGGRPVDLLCWNAANIDRHLIDPRRLLWTEDTVANLPHGMVRGPAEIVTYFEALYDAIPDLRFTVLASVGNEERAIVHWRMTGTHTGGRYEGVASSGGIIDVQGFDDALFRDGKVVTITVLFDRFECARQVGLLPKDHTRLDVLGKGFYNALVVGARRTSARFRRAPTLRA